MDQMATYDAGCAVAAGAREAYITANPLGAGTELEQINTQYWIASFLNGPEAFANFRRNGFPALAPNPYGQPKIRCTKRYIYQKTYLSKLRVYRLIQRM